MSLFSAPGYGTSVFLRSLLFLCCTEDIAASAVFFLWFYVAFPVAVGMWIVLPGLHSPVLIPAQQLQVSPPFRALCLKVSGPQQLSKLRGASSERITNTKQARAACGGWLCLGRG